MRHVRKYFLQIALAAFPSEEWATSASLGGFMTSWEVHQTYMYFLPSAHNLESPEPPVFCTPGLKIRKTNVHCSSNDPPESPCRLGNLPTTPEVPAFLTPYMNCLVSSKKVWNMRICMWRMQLVIIHFFTDTNTQCVHVSTECTAAWELWGGFPLSYRSNRIQTPLGIRRAEDKHHGCGGHGDARDAKPGVYFGKFPKESKNKGTLFKARSLLTADCHHLAILVKHKLPCAAKKKSILIWLRGLCRRTLSRW